MGRPIRPGGAELRAQVETLLEEHTLAGTAPADDQLYRQLPRLWRNAAVDSSGSIFDLRRKEATGAPSTLPGGQAAPRGGDALADLVRNAEFVTTATITSAGYARCCVQIDTATRGGAAGRTLAGCPAPRHRGGPADGVRAGIRTPSAAGSRWWRVGTKIVPVDEVITLTSSIERTPRLLT